MIGEFKNWLDGVANSSWFGTAVTIVVIAAACVFISHVTTIALRKILRSNKGPLPAVSIYVNIARVTIWLIGLGIVLSSCFNVNLGAAITALGIGGIAISLGFQGTLSNFIGGLQITIIGLIEPGDHISVGNYEGVVRDVTWRHTTITTAHNEKVIIPNSVINSQSLVKLPLEIYVSMDLHLAEHGSKPIEARLNKMTDAVSDAISKAAVIVENPQIKLIGMDQQGLLAELTFVVEEGIEKKEVMDIALKAIERAEHRLQEEGK